MFNSKQKRNMETRTPRIRPHILPLFKIGGRGIPITFLSAIALPRFPRKSPGRRDFPIFPCRFDGRILRVVLPAARNPPAAELYSRLRRSTESDDGEETARHRAARRRRERTGERRRRRRGRYRRSVSRPRASASAGAKRARSAAGGSPPTSTGATPGRPGARAPRTIPGAARDDNPATRTTAPQRRHRRLHAGDRRRQSRRFARRRVNRRRNRVVMRKHRHRRGVRAGEMAVPVEQAQQAGPAHVADGGCPPVRRNRLKRPQAAVRIAERDKQVARAVIAKPPATTATRRSRRLAARLCPASRRSPAPQRRANRATPARRGRRPALPGPDTPRRAGTSASSPTAAPALRAAARTHERQTGAATPQLDIQPRNARVKLVPAARLARDRNDFVAMPKAVALERLPPCPRLEVTRRSRRPGALPLVIRHAQVRRQPEPTLKRPTGPLKRPVIPPRRMRLPRHGMHPVTGDVHVEVVGVAMRRRNAPMLPEAERARERALRLPKLRAVKDFPGAQRHDEMICQVRARRLA